MSQLLQMISDYNIKSDKGRGKIMLKTSGKMLSPGAFDEISDITGVRAWSEDIDISGRVISLLGKKEYFKALFLVEQAYALEKNSDRRKELGAIGYLLTDHALADNTATAVNQQYLLAKHQSFAPYAPEIGEQKGGDNHEPSFN